MKAIITLMALGGFCLMPGSVQAQVGVGERDQHYRGGPARPQYNQNSYKPPRVYYPRRQSDVEQPVPPVRIERRPAGSPQAPAYGAPPPAIERIPKT